MLFKIIGSTLIIVSSAFAGYTFSRDCSKRPQDLRTLQGCLQMFENEISFLSDLLIDAFEKIYKRHSSDVGEFFIGTVHHLKSNIGIDASHAWEAAVRENIKKTALNKEDEKILLSFGKMLGNSDLEGQIKNIRLTLNQLESQEKKAEENKKKNEAMYRSLGLLGGIAVVIILI